jgi:hypothetical protein
MAELGRKFHWQGRGERHDWDRMYNARRRGRARPPLSCCDRATQLLSSGVRLSASRQALSSTARTLPGSAPSKPEHHAGLNSTTAHPRPSISPMSTTNTGGRTGERIASNRDQTPIASAGPQQASLFCQLEVGQVRLAEISRTAFKLVGVALQV